MKRIIRKIKKILKIKTYTIQEKKEINKKLKLRKKILKYYKNLPESRNSSEINDALKFVKRYGVESIPYNISKKYDSKKIEIHHDMSSNLRFTLLNNKKMYLKDGGTKEDVKEYVRGLLIEQDIESPHRYLSKEFNVKKGDVVVDIGAAEGNFGLSIIDVCSHLYIFEADEAWISVLEKTFKPWKDKITIVHKFVSDETNEDTVTLDDYFRTSEIIPDFIKIDAEGADILVVKGGAELISSANNLKIAICTYHNQNDEKDIRQELCNRFHLQATPGFMLFYYGKDGYNIDPPFFRKGLLRATKKVSVVC